MAYGNASVSMTDQPEKTADNPWHFYRRAALAPLCLCLVAGLHLVRVAWCGQTPWKGGGFGMFSTVDAESARFVRCYLVTSHGELPLRVPESLARREAELRAAPSLAGAEALAARLAGQRWQWRDERQRRELAEVQAEVGEVGTERVLEPTPANEAGPQAIAFQAVRAEVWRFTFDAPSAQLRCELLCVGEAPRQETQP